MAQGWTVVPDQKGTPASAPGWSVVSEATDQLLAPTEPRKPIMSPAFKRKEHAKAAVDDLNTRTANAGNLFQGWVREGPHRVVEGIKDVAAGNVFKGTHSVASGAAMTALPMIAPEVVPAVVAAPVRAALTAAPALIAQQAAPKVASAFGATPDQADVAGDVAGIGTGTAMAKLGVPALARWSTTNKAKAMGEAYHQSTRDIQAALGVSADDVHAARPFLEAVHVQGVPIVGKEATGGAVDQLTKAANLAVDEIERHVAGVIAQFPRATAPAADRAILAKVRQMPGASPADLDAAQEVIAKYGLDQPRSLADAESLRIRLNAENRSTLEGTGVRQRTAKLTDARYVARQQAADSLRDGIYDTLEQQGVEGIRELRRGEGAVLALRNAADPLTRGLRSESAVARTGETSLLRRIGQRVAPMVGAGTGAAISGGNPVVAAGGAEVGRELTAGLTSKALSRNQLLERAFQQRFTSNPVMSVQRGRGPFSPSPLSPRPRQLPPVALPSANRPGLPSPPQRALPGGARPMGPAPDPSFAAGASASSHVQRDPRTGRMKRVYTSDSK